MTGSRASLVVALAVGLWTLALGANAASATTFCVPTFSAACPNSGGNVAEADLEKAMGLDAEDEIADRIVIAPGTFTETGAFEPEMASNPGSFEPHGSGALTIEGAGPGATILTSAAVSGVYVVNLASNNSRAITIRDLTVRIPDSIPDGQGTAFQLDGDTLDNVDIVSRNLGSQGITSAVGPGNVFRNGEVRGEAGGSIGQALKPNSNIDGSSLLVEDSTIIGAGQVFLATGAGTQLTARRVTAINTGAHGAFVTAGSVTIENSVIRTDDGAGFYVQPVDESATVNADQVTIVNSGGDDPAIEVTKVGGDGDAGVTVSNSILRGFGFGYKAETPIGPGIGQISLEVRYSNLPASGTNVNGTVDIGLGNIDADPLFGADLSLPPGSGSIDAGDPAAGGLATDLLNAPRPTDGNGDGVARRDQGAFEYQPPPPLVAPPPAGDLIAPRATITKGPGGKLDRGIARFRFSSSEAGSTFQCRLDRRKPAKCRSPKTYRGLKPGRHTFRVWATDRAGNRSKPAKRAFRVPG